MVRLNLKTKMSIAISLLVALLMAGLAGLVIMHFQKYFKETISAQEFALVSEMAQTIDKTIQQTQKLIVARAAKLSGQALKKHTFNQNELKAEDDLVSVFDNGIFLFSRSGTMIAEYPDNHRLGSSYAYREYFSKTLSSARPYISAPYISSQGHHHPSVVFTAPVFGSDGTIIAVLAGSIDLFRENFLGRYANMKIGKTGYVFLYNTDRTMIMHPDQSRIMKKDVPLGSNLVFDKGIAGFEGTEETVNSRGLRTLTSVKRLKSADWILAANYPLIDVYAPIWETTHYSIIATVIGIILAVAFVWMCMRFFTAPLNKLTTHIRKISEDGTGTKEIKITTGDEIDDLATSFNRMMQTIDMKTDKLQELSASLQSSLIDTEQEKKRSEAFVAAIGQMVSVQDTDYRIIYQNDIIKNIMGSHLGEYCYRAYHNKDTVCEGCYMVDAFSDGKIHGGEKESIHTDGKRTTVEYTVSPVMDASGKVVAAVELIHDITERKCLEWRISSQYAVSRILSESLTVEESIPDLLKSICEVIGWDVCGIWWIDSRSEYLKLVDIWHRACINSESFKTMSNKKFILPGIGLAGKVWASGSTAWIPDVQSDGNFPLRSAAETCGLHGAFAFPIILGGKTVGVMEFYSREVREFDNGLLEAMVPLGSQLGQLVEQKNTELALRDSQQQLANIIEFLPDATFVVDREKRIISWNLAMEELSGISKKEILGKGDFAYSQVFYEDKRPILVDLLDADESEVSREYQNVQRVGDALFAEAFTPNLSGGRRKAYLWGAATALYNTVGERIGAIEVIRDITERRKMEETLQEALQAADEANNAKSKFLANMSHEIRTPLNGVIGMAQLLETTELDEEQQEYTKLLMGAGRNLLSVINDILDLSKIEAGRIEIEAQDFDLQAEMSGPVNLFSLRAQEKGLELLSLIDPDVPRQVKGDSLRLRQILNNLLGNAIKFTHKGSIILHVQKDCEDETSTTLRFSVCDTGIGISNDKCCIIFDPFIQADGSTTRSYGGTGLGLAISRQLAELMGGSIGVESVEGKGSVFWFTVVLVKQAGGEMIEPRDCLNLDGCEEFPQINTSAGNNIRVLLAEDDPTNQKVIMSTLTKFGYQVDVVNNGSEAIYALENKEYALVLMDCMMPIMNGYEATAVIRNQSSSVRNHSIPIIALTAKAFKEDREICHASGMDDYLSKPVYVADLLAMLGKWVSIESVQETVVEI